MDASAARSVTAPTLAARRSRPRAYLLLSRISNLPTVWTNVLAAFVLAGASLGSLPVALMAASLFYIGGMFLNDAFDATFDAQARADRPIPNGDVSRQEVFAVGAGLLVGGELLLALLPHPAPAMLWGIGLAMAIVFYDYRHKGTSYGPVIMGACRALVYCVAAAGAIGAVTVPVAIAAMVMWAYIVALTVVAKTAGKGSLVPWLLAGICIVDAITIGAAGSLQLAAAAAAGFVLTLALQRVVPGT
jgi:4-hydroxybenzoate polyprenyltransferase